jgi:hypothetical protein
VLVRVMPNYTRRQSYLYTIFDQPLAERQKCTPSFLCRPLSARLRYTRLARKSKTSMAQFEPPLGTLRMPAVAFDAPPSPPGTQTSAHKCFLSNTPQ